MSKNNLDCDTYHCPLYNNHRCKKEIVQIQGGICAEFLSQLEHGMLSDTLNNIAYNILPIFINQKKINEKTYK